MAKTITSMLFGIALADGKIRSLDDRASAYVPEMKGSAYGETTLRSLLTMSSGVAYTETYDGTDDAAEFSRALQRRDSPGAAALLRQYDNREVPEGTRFHYAGSETETLGLVLTAATGQPLPTYASERLWKPLGAEADAAWGIDARGQALAYCCFNARLRDYARLGLLLANDGGGIIPADWVREATSAPREFISRAAQGDAVRGLRLPDLAVAVPQPHVRVAWHPWPVDLRLSGAEARSGAHRGARQAQQGSCGARAQHAVVRAGAPGRRGAGRSRPPPFSHRHCRSFESSRRPPALPALLEAGGERLVDGAVLQFRSRCP